ncbi:MAG TPA: MlaD family protein, partial [Spirochaetia bacterium]|nr:MlaD family protein [Spirochaetia bacterium]
MKANRIIRVIIIIIVALATSLLLYLLINNFQFSRGISVRVHFKNIGDLNTGAWVRKAGIKVGSVTGLTPADDEKTVIVSLSFKPGQIVRQGDEFSLVSKGILGDVYIEQLPGPKTSPPAVEGQLFEG